MAHVEYQKQVKVTLGLTAAQVATTTTTGSWWSMESAHHAAIIFVVGAWTAGVTLNILQATDNAGGSAKALTPAKTLALTAGHADSVQILEVEASELDVAGAFNHIAVQAIAAGAGAILGSSIHRFPLRYEPSSYIT